MKHRLFYLFSIVFLLSMAPNAQAGFWVKKSVVAPAAVSTATAASATITNKTTEVKDDNVGSFSGAKRLVHSSFVGWAYRGWIGILALVCGLAGFLYPGFAFAALLFGLIGMGRKHRNSGVAIAGFILGIIAISLTIFGGFTGFAVF